MFDITLEDYFDETLGEWDTINKVILNPSKRSHRETFIEELERQLDVCQLEDELERMKNACLNEKIEKLMI